jgi:hypothetical protein
VEEKAMIPESEEPTDSCSETDSVWDGYLDDDIEPEESATIPDDPPNDGSP